MAKSATRGREPLQSSLSFHIPAYVVASALRHAPTGNDRHVRALATITEWLMLKALDKRQRDLVVAWQSNVARAIGETGSTPNDDDQFREAVRRMSTIMIP